MPSRAYVGTFNFKGGDQQKKVGLLSGGERNRVHLAKTLRSGANVLMLDEPTNDLDVETLSALENALEVWPGCAVVISHDRWFLDRLATHILAYEGDSHVEWFEGEVISTVGGVRFIKWAQDLVSFVKCEPPSLLFCGGSKHYSAFKDVLAPICIVISIVAVNLEWHLRPWVMLEDSTSQPLKSSLTLKGKSFLHNK